MVILKNEEIEKMVEESRFSERRRIAKSLHAVEHSGPRILINAIQPDSYAAPHRHENMKFGEIFIYVKGRVCVPVFDDNGILIKAPILSSLEDKIIQPPANTYHTIVALEEDSVLCEVSQGPYVHEKFKTFAPWAPLENSSEGRDYLQKLRDKIKNFN